MSSKSNLKTTSVIVANGDWQQIVYISMLYRVSGSLYGRAIGVGLCYLWQSINGTPYPTGTWRWMDPGVMAAIGAAGLLGGVNRIATASTVIVVRGEHFLQ